MKIMLGLGLALSLACISAAESPSDYQQYFGPRVDSSPVIAREFDRAIVHCQAEASNPYRGAYTSGSHGYLIAVRACLSRYNFIDRGAYAALPVTLGLEHFLDR
jgi:hypothetical protein